MENVVRNELWALRKRVACLERAQVQIKKHRKTQSSGLLEVENAMLLLKWQCRDLRAVLATNSNNMDRRAFWSAYLEICNDIPRDPELHFIVSENLFGSRIFCEDSISASDRDLILRFCAFDVNIYKVIARALQGEKEVVAATLSSSPYHGICMVLDVIKNEHQLENVDLFIDAVGKLPLRENQEIHGSVYSKLESVGLGENQDFVLAWANQKESIARIYLKI
jgi:hypothetical protein